MSKKIQKEKLKKGRGRPSKYDTIDMVLLQKLSAAGLTDKQMSEVFEISEDTFNEYKKRPEFSETLKEGKSIADEKVERALFERALGFTHKETKFFAHEGIVIDSREVDKVYPPDVTACIFWLKNRNPKEWRDKQEMIHSGEVEHKHSAKETLLEKLKNVISGENKTTAAEGELVKQHINTSCKSS
ncbi:MAG: helix-turn-helix domain-containing protein [Deltaproteobacteria bacterium]|nr:helix-turn-helix domain-containing protein [Deltaproteobacteria bacterium]